MRKPDNEFHFKCLGIEISARGSLAVVVAAVLAMTIIMFWGLR